MWIVLNKGVLTINVHHLSIHSFRLCLFLEYQLKNLKKKKKKNKNATAVDPQHLDVKE